MEQTPKDDLSLQAKQKLQGYYNYGERQTQLDNRTPGGAPVTTPGISEPWPDPEVCLVKLPEDISFEAASNYSDIKKLQADSIGQMEKIMRQSLEDIEGCYKNYVKKIKAALEEKASQYKKIQQQLETNNVYITNYAKDVQQVLDYHREVIIDEKNIEYKKLRTAQEQWKREIDTIYKKNNFKSPILTLDVGGQLTLKTSKALLCSIPGSLLERTFNGYHEHTILADKIFVDRDPTAFKHLVNYLRLQRNYVPLFENKNEEELFVKELKYWDIQVGLFGKQIEEKKLCDQLPLKLIDLMQSEPQGITSEALTTWKDLGPLKFIDIVEKSFDKLDFSLKKVSQSTSDPSIIGQIDVDEYGLQQFVHGVGRQIIYENGSIYEGQFKNENKNGYGRQIFEDGEYYVGQFKNDKREGLGSFIFKSGRIQQGNWKNDQFLG